MHKIIAPSIISLVEFSTNPITIEIIAEIRRIKTINSFNCAKNFINKFVFFSFLMVYSPLSLILEFTSEYESPFLFEEK